MLLLDEPCSALDPISTQTIEDLIVRLRTEVAVVIVTHNLQQAHRIADKVAFMYLGDLVEYGDGGRAVRRPARGAHARVRVGGVRMIASGTPSLLGILGLAALLVLGCAGCESTQDKSARLSRSAAKVKVQKGLAVTSANAGVKVEGTTVLTDANGSAVAVLLRNTTSKPQVDVPVLVDVRDAKGVSVFKNDSPGIEAGLTHVSVLPPGRQTIWVNDQVFAATTPKSVKATVGEPQGSSPAARAELKVSDVALTDDPASGVGATGVVTNTGSVEQRKVLVTAVARRGGAIVAAGRGVVQRARPGKRARFRVFFIGNPKNAALSVTAQPPVPPPSS